MKDRRPAGARLPGLPGTLQGFLVMAVGAGILLAGCGTNGGAPPGATGGGQNSTVQASKRPDPSDPAAHPLGTLVADPLFTVLPPQSKKTSERQIPAHNDPIVFGSGGSFGAGYRVEFTSTAPPQDVYADVAKRAAAGGWMPEDTDAKGRTVKWGKAYPHGSRASVMFFALDQDGPSPPYTYSLNGSI